MNKELRKYINESIKKELGISYDQFELLDIDEQQKLIENNRKRKKSNSKNILVMIGSGEHAMFVNIKHGEKYMLDDGTFAKAGDTIKQSRNRLEDEIDDIIYSKPIAFVKK